MHSAEIRVVREGLGLTVPVMASLLGVPEATMKNWEKGRYAPSEDVARDISSLEAWTRRCVDVVAEESEHAAVRAVVVYRLTTDMPPGPARTMGAAWWRAVAWRARERVPGLAVTYESEADRLSGSRERTLTGAITAETVPHPPQDTSLGMRVLG